MKLFKHRKNPEYFLRSLGAGMIISLAELVLFGYALFCLIPTTSGKIIQGIGNVNLDQWLHASVAFLLARVLARRRGAETWVSVGWQSTIFAFFSYIILNQ